MRFERQALAPGRQSRRSGADRTRPSGAVVAPGTDRPGTGAPCACGGGCPACRSEVAEPATISMPGDRGEVEADRLADQALAGRAPARSSRASAPTASRAQTGVPASVATVLRGTGEPLEAPVRSAMEPRFGMDFGHVRVFRGAEAERSARQVGARAYTVGSAIVFAPGRYAPGSHAGERLLAHELAHVVQNASAAPGSAPVLQRADDRDDDVVQEHIDKALARNNGKVSGASLSLMALRDESGCGDENMAAADHYMFARWLVGDLYIPAATVNAMTAGYALFKIGAVVPYAIINAIIGPCQASPPSFFQVKWGLKGVADAQAKDRPWYTSWW